MSKRARLAIAGAIALVAAIGMAVIVAGWVSDDHVVVPLGRDTRPAVAPFAGYREASVKIDGRCARVVLADTQARREQGLRDARDLGPYAGMLFVQETEFLVPFTMSGVTSPLDIAWFSSDGSRVGSQRMLPCPRSTADCPEYTSPGPYRYALETPAGASQRVSVSPCV